jgi:hypothetical protein
MPQGRPFPIIGDRLHHGITGAARRARGETGTGTDGRRDPTVRVGQSGQTETSAGGGAVPPAEEDSIMRNWSSRLSRAARCKIFSTRIGRRRRAKPPHKLGQHFGRSFNFHHSAAPGIAHKCRPHTRIPPAGKRRDETPHPEQRRSPPAPFRIVLQTCQNRPHNFLRERTFVHGRAPREKWTAAKRYTSRTCP